MLKPNASVVSVPVRLGTPVPGATRLNVSLVAMLADESVYAHCRKTKTLPLPASVMASEGLKSSLDAL